MNGEDRSWVEHFKIQSLVDLDFVIGQRFGYPIGMQRNSPPDFRRRVLAAAASYQLQLSSIDYALKRYVRPEMYEERPVLLGDEVSDYLRDCSSILEEELKKLHAAENPTFGVFGAEISLYRIPYALDAARILSNRGLLLEVLPILRLCLEMMCWASVAFRLNDEDKVVALKAQNCINAMKPSYKTVGQIYGYLSRFSHWGHVIHGHFLDFSEDRVAVLKAAVRYRAMTLALCLVILDVLVEVIRSLYLDKSRELVLRVQGVLARDETRRAHQYVSKIVDLSGLNELREIKSLLSPVQS